MRRGIRIILGATLLVLSLNAAEVSDEPIGIYKTIDVRLLNDTIKALHDYNPQKQTEVEAAVMAKPELFAPPALYMVSSLLFRQGKNDEAAFWFCAGQLRARIDANICADKSAGKFIEAMNQKFAPPFYQYTLTNLTLLTNTVERVQAWEENTPCRYDRRWINLHGMNAFTGETNSPLSAPLDQWEAIRKRTRDMYAPESYKVVDEFHRRSR